MTEAQSLIENAFTSAVEKLAKDESGNFIGDLYVQTDAESGELRICDDGEHLIEKIVIFGWVNSSEEESVLNKWVAASVRAVLTILSIKNISGVPRFTKPLSASLTDEDFVVIEELLLTDDDMPHLDDPLLKDLDVDLDDFSADLLADVE